MINLVIKDVLIQKRTFIYAILYGIFAIFAFSSFGAGGAYMIGGMSIVYMLILYANGYDEKNKSEVILNSLPVNRSSIVTAKYAAILLFFLMGVLIVGASGAAVTALNILPNMRYISLSDILGIFISTVLMHSLYYPLFFKFGSLKLKILNIGLYMIFLFVPNILASMVKDNPDNNMVIKILSMLENNPPWMLGTFSAIVVAILMIVSMEISIWIYRHKEF